MKFDLIGAPEPKPPRPELVPCPDCKKEVSGRAMSCPQCGRKLKQSAVGVMAAIIIALIIGGILYALVTGLRR
jgi:hypothetical protein